MTHAQFIVGFVIGFIAIVAGNAFMFCHLMRAKHPPRRRFEVGGFVVPSPPPPPPPPRKLSDSQVMRAILVTAVEIGLSSLAVFTVLVLLIIA